MGTDEEIEGIIAVADEVRPAACTVSRLRDTGVERTVMLTGDNERTAQAIAREGRHRRLSGRTPARRESRRYR